MTAEAEARGLESVEDCIARVMRKYPTFTPAREAEYYFAVHQELAPLARALEKRIAALEAELAAGKADAAKYQAALGLIWSVHVRKEVHLGLERWSGFEQNCIACICALVLGQCGDESPTTEQLVEKRAQLKAGDAAALTPNNDPVPRRR